MSDLTKIPNRTPRNNTQMLKWKNMSGETIPAYACIKLDSYNATDDFYNAVKPDGEGNLHFVNGPVSIADGKYGGSMLWNHSRIGKTTSTTFGSVVGPIAGSWEMSEAGSGFVVFSEPADGVAAIISNGSGTGGSYSIWGTIDEVICDEYGDQLLTYALVTVTWFSAGCTAAIPGEDSYTGQIEVHQVCDIFTAYYTAEDLVGKTIEAGYYCPRTGGCEPKWLLRQVCGQPECA